MSGATAEIEVGLGDRRYPIRIAEGLLSDSTHWHYATRGIVRGGHVLIVSDENVATLYAARVREALASSHLPLREGGAQAPSEVEVAPATEGEAGRRSEDAPWMDACRKSEPSPLPLSRGERGSRRVDVLILRAGETHKNLDAVSRAFDALAKLGATRDACVIALGGGVIGDIAGFAAACWMRGIDFIQMPTTLLAMVDSSVGGKTGVNHAAGKNLIGAFHQPRAVIADLDTLTTLPERELRAGFAEVIKTACIGDPEFFDWLEANVDSLLARDAQSLTHAIATCCRFKAGVVERDERETGERALLNFGHSFGHAIETEAGYGTLLHGEAVAAGMMLAARLSAQMAMSSEADTQRLRALLRAFGLPTELPDAALDLDPGALLDRMRLDKKNRANTLRLILWRGIGKAEIVENVLEGDVLSAL